MNYVVKLSDRTEIQIDGEELEAVLTGIRSGNPVRVKQGIFNPSFFTAIVLDEDRVGTERQVFNPEATSGYDRVIEGPYSLGDIFRGVLKTMEKPKELK